MEYQEQAPAEPPDTNEPVAEANAELRQEADGADPTNFHDWADI